MNDTVELTFNIKHALVIVFAVGFLVGGTGTMLALNLTGTPAGAITAGTQDSGDGGGSAPSDTGSQQQDGSNNGGNTVSVSNIKTDNEPSLGSTDAKVTIVEFSDYQCPFCRRFALQTFDKIKQNYIDTGKVRFVYKDFPLTQLGHTQAPLMAVAAQCAGDQGKYWEMHDKLFDEQQKLSPRGTAKFSSDKVPQWASEIGLNMNTFKQCLNSDKYKSEVQSDLQEGQSLGASGTPTFFIYAEGDDTAQKVVGAQPYSRFQSVIDQKLNDGGSQDTAGGQDVDKTIQVSGTEYSFSPSTITVKQGQTVKVEFTNTGQIPHDLRIPDLGTGTQTIRPGQTDSFTFTASKSGTFPIQFICSLPGHAQNGMTGKLTSE